MTSGTTSSLTAGQALQEAAERTAGLLRAVHRPDAPVPGLAWTVSQTAAHMAAELRDYAAFTRGEQDPGAALAPGGKETAAQRNAAANTAQLARFTERDLSRLASMMVPAADDFAAAAGRCRPGDRILASNGLYMTVPTMTAALLGELLIHGLDIARAAKIPWPISRADALHVIAGVMAMVPDYLDRRRAAGRHVSYELRLRGGPRYHITIDDGTAAVTGPGPRADCWISADPAAFLLVGYGRAGQWTQIIRGNLLAGGRKPWLGPAFGQLITSP
jgi:uncharacterized protein (TIGR03083 family)